MMSTAPLRRVSQVPRTAGAALCALALIACSDRIVPSSTSPAARVHKDEISVQQVDFVLQQQRGLKPEQADAAGRQVLERLIDQQLALQKAGALGIDRDPRVLQQIDAARREIIARAFVDKLGSEVGRPTAAEIQQYYDEHPALFKQRRVYNLQELQIEASPEQVETLRAELKAAKDIGQFLDYLKTKGFKFSANQAVRAAEQLPLQSLEAFGRMKDGQAALVPGAHGVQIIVVVSSLSQPVGAEQAAPAIEQFLVNERRRKRVAEEIKALRGAATIEYFGRFARGSAPDSPAAPASGALPRNEGPLPSALTPSGGGPGAGPAPGALGSDEIGKGLGLAK